MRKLLSKLLCVSMNVGNSQRVNFFFCRYLKNACVAVGVKGEAFDGARDALCGKHNVKDMDKGMGDVMADLAGALNKALGELAKEE